jgi:fatty acid desaturase
MPENTVILDSDFRPPVRTGRSPSRAEARYVSAYTELSRMIRQRGLLRRRYAYYWTRIILVLAAFAAIWVGVALLGNSWFQLLLAAALAIVLTQVGFLSHDGAHRQIFRSAAWNEWTARVLATAVVGMSVGWWKAKHNRHHATPNQQDRDPDIKPGVVAFTPEAVARRSGLAGWLARHQGWFFYPLLTLEGLNLHAASLRQLLQPRSMPHQFVEGALVLARLAGYVTVLLILLPPGKAGAFLGVQLAVFGVCLGGSFAPNHKGMPIVPATMKLDFLRRQVLMSRNIRGGVLVDFVMGGLNYQIEHHLFPSMPRPNLKKARPLVRDYCARHQVRYTETGLFASYRIVVDYLNNVGLRARDPFRCPLVTECRN